MRTRVMRFLLAAAVASLAALPVWAASTTAYLQVSVRVVPNCLVSVTSLAFGTYDPLSANADRPLDATAELQMHCTKNTPVTIVFDSGNNATASNRAMLSGADHVAYDLFRDSAHTQKWADGENSLRTLGVGGRDPQTFTVFGRVPPGQEVPPGAYEDVITATVDF